MSRLAANSSRPRAAFYDLDGTLAALNLVDAGVFVFGKLREWNRRVSYMARLICRLPVLYVAERSDRTLLNRAIFQTFKGVSRDRLTVVGEEYCDYVMTCRLYPQALELMEQNRAVGLEPVLVTGSPDFMVAPLARRLGVSDFAANRLVYRQGVATGALREPVMAGSEKAAWCVGYAAARGLDLSACWAYADSHYDLPFLCAVGHPVAVNPDSVLEAFARARHWPIVRFEIEGRLHGAASFARHLVGI
jgi:fatty acyl-CoA reductase